MNTHPWQQQMFDRITSGGIKPGEMMITSAGRGTGKSAFSSQFWMDGRADSWFRGASAECDDGVWHSVVCFSNVAAWIRAQDPVLWMETSHPNSIGNTFDIDDSLLVLLSLRWGASRA
jgi:hypothetical protein